MQAWGVTMGSQEGINSDAGFVDKSLTGEKF